MEVIFHRRTQRDLRAALGFYETEGGSRLADRFFAEVENAVAATLRNPKACHFIDDRLCRIAVRTFPYHFLYEETTRS